jgi:23S rRNA-/tRNA-specific pseudouridylate synthase
MGKCPLIHYHVGRCTRSRRCSSSSTGTCSSRSAHPITQSVLLCCCCYCGWLLFLLPLTVRNVKLQVSGLLQQQQQQQQQQILIRPMVVPQRRQRQQTVQHFTRVPQYYGQHHQQPVLQQLQQQVQPVVPMYGKRRRQRRRALLHNRKPFSFSSEEHVVLALKNTVNDNDGDNDDRVNPDDDNDTDHPKNVLLLPLLPFLREGMPKGFYIVQEYIYTSVLPPNIDTATVPNIEQQQRLSSMPETSEITTTTTTSCSSERHIPNQQQQQYDRVRIDVQKDDAMTNVTVPIALTLLDPITYPSLSRARKACRKGNILIIRNQNMSTSTVSDSSGTWYTNSRSRSGTTNPNDGKENENDNQQTHQKNETSTSTTMLIGRVGDRVYDGDTVCVQVRMSSNHKNNNGYNNFPMVQGMGHKEPPFVLPVLYQDNHYALVNKPAGIVCYRQGAGGTAGYMSIRAALPFVLTPPIPGTYSVLRRPASVHRLDKPTSGLLCIVKTKPAMVHMSKQFHDRIVQKTYIAIVNGIPYEDSNAWITSDEAMSRYGIDIECTNDHDENEIDSEDSTGASSFRDMYQCTSTTKWQVIDTPLNDQHAITVWRVLKYVRSLRGRDGYLTLMECKPKTGRYHQIRRHMAYTAQRCIVGDVEYDGNHPEAVALRGNGLFLCATSIVHEHPYYNTKVGRQEWDDIGRTNGLPEDMNDGTTNDPKSIVWYNVNTDKVMISAQIELPSKFESLLIREEERYLKFHPSAKT